MLSKILITFATAYLLFIFTKPLLAIDDDTDDDHAFYYGHNHQHDNSDKTNLSNQKMLMTPKDKILLKDVKTLIFFRNKRTTSRRTHSIHQLSCIGGTAGCKLFTPDSVECENIVQDKGHDAKHQNWKCHADISDRVHFSRVEVTCEGYDYPEDDYILIGSCGLEFMLDYTDPLDYHHNSYFEHMDEHEKEMHNERIRSTAESAGKPIGGSGRLKMGYSSVAYVYNLVVANHLILVCLLLILFGASFLIIVRYTKSYYSSSNNNRASNKKKSSRLINYGPLTSTVMTTKKAC